MWQSVILLDTIMPKSCIECMHFDGFKCDITEDIIEGNGDNKPSTCPIRSLPQKKHNGLAFKSDGTAFTKEMEIGWNACLDEITDHIDESTEKVCNDDLYESWMFFDEGEIE